MNSQVIKPIGIQYFDVSQLAPRSQSRAVLAVRFKSDSQSERTIRNTLTPLVRDVNPGSVVKPV